MGPAHTLSPYERDYVTPQDIDWMRCAIKAASKAAHYDDMPFGCVIVTPSGHPFSTAWGTGHVLDPTSHSEIRAIQDACRARRSEGLLRGFSLYSTHEPCVMCCGAINHAKLTRVVFGSYRQDLPEIFRSKAPAKVLLRQTSHPPIVIGEVLRTECINLFKGVAKWD